MAGVLAALGASGDGASAKSASDKPAKKAGSAAIAGSGKAKPKPTAEPGGVDAPEVEAVVASTGAAELEQRLARAARAPDAVFEVPGTEWRLRISSVAVAITGGDVVISLVPEPDIGSVQIRGRPSLVGRNAWRAERLRVSVDTPILAEQLEGWIGQQIRGTEPRSLDAIFGPSASFTSAAPGANGEPPRVLPLASEIRAGRLEPQALSVEGAAIRLAAELKPGAGAAAPAR